MKPLSVSAVRIVVLLYESFYEFVKVLGLALTELDVSDVQVVLDRGLECYELLSEKLILELEAFLLLVHSFLDGSDLLPSLLDLFALLIWVHIRPASQLLQLLLLLPYVVLMFFFAHVPFPVL